MISCLAGLYTILLILLYISGQNHGYYLSLNHLTWDESLHYCQNYCNSNLASIHNKSQNDEIIETIESGHSYPLLDKFISSSHVFIGLYDDKSIYQYKWSDETAFSFGTDFGEYPWLKTPPQPDSIDNVNCVQIRANSNYGWDDVACTRHRHAICNSCSGKLNKYTILKNEYDYIDANIQCNTQIGTTLASIHSERDLMELKALCQLYKKPNDCWIGLHNNTSFDYANLLYQNIDKTAYPICNIPSELCRNDSVFAVFNGDISLSECQYVWMDHNGRNDGIMLNRKYLNQDGVVLIDYLFKMHGKGRGGIIVPISSCSAYYIGVSLMGESNTLFVQYIEYDGSSTNYDVIPLITTNLQHPFNASMYHLLSVQINRIQMVVSLHNDNIIQMVAEEFNVYSVSVGIWSEYSDITAKSLYVSGTSIYVENTQYPICIFPEIRTNPAISSSNAFKVWLYGIVLSLTFDEELDINDTVIIKHIILSLISDTIPQHCIDFDHFDIDAEIKDKKTVLNATIFVCNAHQQQVLLAVFDANHNITTLIMQDLEGKYDIETDIIEIYESSVVTTQYIGVDLQGEESDGVDATVVIIGVTVAVTAVIVMVMTGTHCLKLRLQNIDRKHMEMNIFENETEPGRESVQDIGENTVCIVRVKSEINEISKMVIGDVASRIVCGAQYDDEVHGSLTVAEGKYTEAKEGLYPFTETPHIVDDAAESVPTLPIYGTLYS